MPLPLPKFVSSGRTPNLPLMERMSSDTAESTVKVSQLPRDFTTKDLWDCFYEIGDIAFIEVFENRNNRKAGAGLVIFR
jgi:hypothetical protein